jgi:hypothetical protein
MLNGLLRVPFETAESIKTSVRFSRCRLATIAITAYSIGRFRKRPENQKGNMHTNFFSYHTSMETSQAFDDRTV